MAGGSAKRRRTISLIDRLASDWPLVPRERLVSCIVCGDVRYDGGRIREPRHPVPSDAVVTVSERAHIMLKAYGYEKLERTTLGHIDDHPASKIAQTELFPLPGVPPLPYVSRGGEKLAGVLDDWKIPVQGRVFLDAGSSTGGFTHCLLLHGAALVHAVDVGYNQMDWRLRNCPLVQVHERTNIMGLEALDPPPVAAVADISFRTLVAPALRIFKLTQGGELIALIKPQFERKYQTDGRQLQQFSGVVSEVELGAILSDFALRSSRAGICIQRMEESPLRGGEGNREFLALLKPGDGDGNQAIVGGLDL